MHHLYVYSILYVYSVPESSHHSFAKNEWKMWFGFENWRWRRNTWKCAVQSPQMRYIRMTAVSSHANTAKIFGCCWAWPPFSERSASAVCALKAPNVVNIWIVEQLKPQFWLWSHWTLLQTIPAFFHFWIFRAPLSVEKSGQLCLLCIQLQINIDWPQTYCNNAWINDLSWNSSVGDFNDFRYKSLYTATLQYFEILSCILQYFPAHFSTF